ncbi:hypothetical protein [Methanobrevibacter millerae]|uniref:Uncharacterized protein n=1 Tax=Methanobrevibacter millerae TaxID=230361 RepID=A0A1G5VS59_9EURY|nr:hypothetical protein [Methanobrevibacter millerae]SDA48682.1 hypothetical protein SAMN02910315_00835 [Methanobrevibacter millerae]
MTYRKAFEDNVVNFKVLDKKTWDVFEFSHLANKIYINSDGGLMGDSIFEKVVLDNISWTIIKDESKSNIKFITSFDDRYFIRLYFEASQDHMKEFALKRIENEFTLGYIAKYDANEEYRWYAYKKVSDKHILADIALNAKDWKIRFDAGKNRIHDVFVLCDMYLDDPCPEISSTMRARMSEIKKERPDWYIRD